MAFRRQPNSCEGDIPYRCATAETFASGASASSKIRALISSSQLRLDTAGLFSARHDLEHGRIVQRLARVDLADRLGEEYRD